MKRRGFLGGLLAAVIAPALPAVSSELPGFIPIEAYKGVFPMEVGRVDSFRYIVFVHPSHRDDIDALMQQENATHLLGARLQYTERIAG